MSLPCHIIGTAPNHWVHIPASESRSSDTFDLTRPSSEAYSLPSPSRSLHIKTNNNPKALTVIASPQLTALVIIDMQNFFLSPALGRDPAGAGHQAMSVLERLVPRCRAAGIRVIWCNWGMTEKDLLQLPPAIAKGFGALNVSHTTANVQGEPLKDTKPARIYKGFGAEMGMVDIAGEKIDAGRQLMRTQWNSALPPALQAVYNKNSDAWIDKNRMSGLWNTSTPLYDYLRTEGIRTLLFAGVNTDQCVQGTLVDAYNSGWDCLLVRDACGTGTPSGREVTEWNVGRSWGFLVDSDELTDAIEQMH